MLYLVYRLSLFDVCLLMLLLLFGWTYCCARIERRACAGISFILFCLSMGMILFTTLLSRSANRGAVVLQPFAAFAAARQQPELYREMLMNVFLFFPLGLTLSNVLPQKWNRWGRIALTTLFACLLSAGIEYAQYRFALGMAETDDVICNTLGALLGACSLQIQHAAEKWQKE